MLKPRHFIWFLLQLLILRGSPDCDIKSLCSGVSLRSVDLQSAASTIYIEEDSSLHLVPDPQLLNGSDLYWQSSGSPISEYQCFLTCSEQDPNVVVDPNGRDLLMIGIDDTSAAQRLFVSNGSKTISVQLKITKKPITATDVSTALTWIGIIGGFCLVMLVFAVVVRFMRRPSKLENSQRTEATTAAKQSDAQTRNETLETQLQQLQPLHPLLLRLQQS